MSGGFVYSPVNIAPSVYLESATHQQPQFSPFVPSGTFPSSPYSNHASLPGTPHVGQQQFPVQASPNTILFPATGPIYAEPVWAVPMAQSRDRRPSFHAAVSTPAPNWLNFSPPQRQRTLSSGHNPYLYQPGGLHGQWPPAVAPPSPFSPGFSQLPTVPQQLFLHPWLNAEVPRSDFIFDLSLSVFYPQRVVGPGQIYPVSQDDLIQPASHPPMTSLKIVCDMIPQWPVELRLDPRYSPGVSPPPISLGDVLGMVHTSLHTGITHVDWARLNATEESAVGAAYTKRCKAAGSLDTVEKERRLGVKRVDYLMGKTWFKGLVMVPGEAGTTTMKLIVG